MLPKRTFGDPMRGSRIGTPVACGVAGMAIYWLATNMVRIGWLGASWGNVLMRCASVVAYMSFVTVLVVGSIGLPMTWAGVQSARAGMLIKALGWILVLSFAVTSRWLIGPVLPQWLLLFLMAAGIFGAIATGAAAIMAGR